jgi:hypothetical protein
MLLSIAYIPFQVCLHSASHAAVKHMGVVMYLDTSNSFSPSRIATLIDGTNDLSDQRGRQSPICLACSYLLSFFEFS